MKLTLLLFVVLAFQYCQQPLATKNVADPIAKAHGVENFEKAELIEFTFNVQRDTAPPSKRQWQWFPKTNEVVFITDSVVTKFQRNDTSTPELKKLNARFTNDEYWLLYPFHLTWDKGMKILDSNQQVAPISGKNFRKMTILYNKEDGYTPGDRYDIYVDDQQRIQEWAFHKSASEAPSLITTWENYTNFNGMQLATEHKSLDGKFRLWFTGINVK